MTSDAVLRSQYDSLKAKRDRYKKVAKGISDNQLNYKRSTSEMDDYIDYIDSITKKIDEQSGYSYIESASSKLKTNRNILQEYVDFVQNSNSSFMDLYDELNSQITSLQSQMDAVRIEYNKGKIGFDRLGLEENWTDIFGGLF